MTPTYQFIEDCLAGGYRKENPDFSAPQSLALLLLDPLAWQAVGKTRRWPSNITAVEDGKSVVRMPQWQYNWHRFIDHLANGRTIEEALAAIQDGV